MKLTLSVHYKISRTASALMLIVLISVKVVLPVWASLNTVDKETSTATDQGDNTEKKTENNPLPEKEKDFANVINDQVIHQLWFTEVMHYTAYYNNYQASHFFSILIPPPNFYLRFSA